ncbi:TspO/MBR family protein [Saccharopolyspora sp. CA-218241]|uniref:TspO/MBR family protein n=1 Tax=Saccharopolyspora sp. CA-218241 TaxID=3240027 RepID=UPI003D99C563
MPTATTRNRPPVRSAVAAAVLFAAAVALVAAVGSWAAATSAEQYAALRLPGWAPPAALFGPVWTVLYVLLAFAGWRLWYRAADGRELRRSLTWYGVGLVLNALWTPLFFAAQARAWALLDIALLDVAVVGLLVLAARRDRLAAAALVPYLLWVLYATALTTAILTLNG